MMVTLSINEVLQWIAIVVSLYLIFLVHELLMAHDRDEKYYRDRDKILGKRDRGNEKKGP